MLAVAHPTTSNSSSPTPPTTTPSVSSSSSSSTEVATMQRKVTATSSVNFRASVPSRGTSGSIHFQHQVPPSRTASYHVNGHGPSASTSSTIPPTTTPPPNPNQKRPPTPPPPPPPDSLPQQPTSPPQPAFDIASYSSIELLKLLASLLTQIAATNDSLSSPHSSGHASSSSSNGVHSPQVHSPIWSTLTAASRTALSTPASTLTFHARNIPTITLESYFLRILKYCPTTNHVFLSLLVYFDRMAKLSLESTGRAFVIDSYNVHRLVIAGVTVASKFFSDVFYTNSRYAKVGGLPLPELNQLELQFLLLNDFRLVIKGEEMQRYAEQLILFSKSNAGGKEVGKEIQIPRDVKEADAAETSGSNTSPVKPAPPAPMMLRRDSQHAYSSFPSALGGSSSTSSSSKLPHLGAVSAATTSFPQHSHQHDLSSQHVTSSATSLSSPQRTPNIPFQQLHFSGISAPSMVRKRSTTPPAAGSATFHPSHPTYSRVSSSFSPSADVKRRAAPPPPVSRRTPPIHITSRNTVNGRPFGQTATYSDDDEDESDDYDESDDEDDRSPARRRRRHIIPIHNDAETETETETDAGETTDGGSGSTTSDEPTVKPVGVGRRPSMSTSTSSFENDVDQEVVAESQNTREMLVDGEGTPEVMRHHTPRGEGPEEDVNMGSPVLRRAMIEKK